MPEVNEYDQRVGDLLEPGRNRDTDWFSVTDGEWPQVRAANGRSARTRPTSMMAFSSGSR